MKTHFVILFSVVATLVGCTKAAEVTPETRPSVARFVNTKSSVEYKRLDTLIWERAEVGLDLYSRDSVRTGASAESDIKFVDDQSLHVGENSTIIIQDYRKTDQLKTATLSLAQGTVAGAVSDDTPTELTVQTSRGWLRVTNTTEDNKKLEPAEFRANVKADGKTEFHLDKGRAVFVTKTKEIALKSGDQISVSGPESDLSSPADIDSKNIARVVFDANLDETVEKPKAVASSKETKGFAVISPADKSVIDAEAVTVKGRADLTSEVYLNGEKLQVGGGGQFSIQVALKPGANILVFQIVDKKTNEIIYKNLELSRKN